MVLTQGYVPKAPPAAQQTVGSCKGHMSWQCAFSLQAFLKVSYQAPVPKAMNCPRGPLPCGQLSRT